MSPVISGVFQQKFTKFWNYVAKSSPLLMRTFRQWYCNSFSSDTAKNASCISRRSWHFPKLSWLPWQRPLTYLKTMYRSIIHTQDAFIWWKDCKKSVQYILRYSTNMSDFRHVVKKFTNEPRFLWIYWTKVHEIFKQYRHHLRCKRTHWGSYIPFRFGMPQR